VTDRLGSVRYSGAGSYSYFPYGEERTVTTDDTEKFGTYLRDGPGQDYAPQRYYNNGTGRFWNVDPGGIKTANPADPGSLNRYAYTGGDPVNYYDPMGTNREEVGDGGFIGDPICVINPEVCSPWGGGPVGTGVGGGAGGTSAFPMCNPSNSPSQETDLSFIKNNYSSAMSAANTIQADLQAINQNLAIDTNALAVTFLQWSASETGTINGWGTSYLLTIQHNYFGGQVGAAGSIPCTGTQLITGSANACFSPSMSLSGELLSVLSGVPHTLTNPNPNNVSYLSDLLAILVSNPNAGTATIIQGIANAGWNASSTYGSKVAGANVQGMVDCMKRNNYIQ
jgi:RHS repeat-associated protein